MSPKHRPINQYGENLDSYFKDINYARKKINRGYNLGQKQEVELAYRGRQGDKQALDTLVVANLSFVISVAKRYQNRGLPLKDLINDGNLGLIKAAKRFKEKKIKFISYAVWWIRQAINYGLAEHSRIVKIPLNRTSVLGKIGKAKGKLENKYRRLPDTKEIAQEVGCKEEEVMEFYRISGRHTSFNAPVGEEGKDLIEFFEDQDQEDTDHRAVNNSLEKEIKDVLETLNVRERRVIKLYYGVDEDTNHTLEEIGVYFSITRERVRTIKDNALKKLGRSRRIKQLRDI